MGALAKPEGQPAQPSKPAAPGGELGRLAEAARRKRLAHLVDKLRAWGQGVGPPLTRAEVREIEAAGGEAPTPPGTVRSEADLARSLGVSSRSVRLWKGDGLPKHPDGYYVLAEVARWRRLRARRGSKLGGARETAELEYRQAKAELEQLRLARARGELIDRADVERGRVARVIAVRRRLQLLPRLAAPIVSGLSPREAEAWLETWVRDTLGSFAEDRAEPDSATRAELDKLPSAAGSALPAPRPAALPDPVEEPA